MTATDEPSEQLSVQSPATSLTSQEQKKNGLWESYLKATDVLTSFFPLWTVIFAGLALKRPQTFAWFTTKYFTASLAILMLSMGITLTPADFDRAFQQPGPGTK